MHQKKKKILPRRESVAQEFSELLTPSYLLTIALHSPADTPVPGSRTMPKSDTPLVGLVEWSGDVDGSGFELKHIKCSND